MQMVSIIIERFNTNLILWPHFGFLMASSDDLVVEYFFDISLLYQLSHFIRDLFVYSMYLFMNMNNILCFLKTEVLLLTFLLDQGQAEK